MNINLDEKNSARLLSALIIARSSSFLVSKLALVYLSPLSLLAARFLLAFSLLTIIFFPKLKGITKVIILYGAVLGGLFASVMTFDLLSLRTCSTSTTSFLENSAIVMVPIINSFITKKLPERRTIMGSVTALCGVAVLALSQLGSSKSEGIIFGLCAAVLYSFAIILTGIFSKKADPFLIGIVQVGSIGVFSLMAAAFTGTLAFGMPTSKWIYVIYLAVVCSGFGFTLQPMCQKKVKTEIAGLFCAISPLSCTILGIIFLREQLSLSMLIGCFLIICGMIVPHLHMPRLHTALNYSNRL